MISIELNRVLEKL